MELGVRRVMQKYLITGGAGFIGSHLADNLLASGNEIIVLDDLSTGRLENIEQNLVNPKFKFVEGSILDEELVSRMIEESDQVLHLAAAVGVFSIMKDPLGSLKTNIRGSEIVLENACKFMKPVLVTSTSEIYGKNTSDLLSEDDDRILGSATKTRWSYSEAKAIEEFLAYSYWKTANLETRIVRLFNTVGPRQVGSYGMVIPRFISAAIAGESIQVYGNGEQTRCFGHVSDISQGIISVLNSRQTIGEVLNLGVNFEISIIDLAQLIIKKTNSTSKIELVPYDQAYEEGFEDMQRRVPDTRKIEKITGWKAKLNLEQIIDDVISYQLSTQHKV